MKFREYFTTALKGTPYISDPSYSVITNRPALFFSAPVTDGKVVYAVVRTFWKSRLARGGSYFGNAVVLVRVDVVSHALRKSAQRATQARRKKGRLRNGAGY